MSTPFRASNSSRHWPPPMATDCSGFLATMIGMPVSADSRLSRPCSSAPPPVRTMPCSMMSAASSGGLVERDLHRVDDGSHGLLDGVADLGRAAHDRLGQAGDEVAAADLGVQLLLELAG